MRNIEISTELKVKFEREINVFTKELQTYLEGPQKLFGNVITPKMPTYNTNDILNNYIKEGTNYLRGLGLRYQRARSVSKYTFETILNQMINDVER